MAVLSEMQIDTEHCPEVELGVRIGKKVCGC